MTMVKTKQACDATAIIGAAKRLVIKVGSSLLIRENKLDHAWLSALADDIARLSARNAEILVVSSGAVALGRGALGLTTGRRVLEESQAAAAAGQTLLVSGWRTAFEPHDLRVAQILLTPEDTEQRRRYLNARRTIETLLNLNVIPVINENDTVTTQELRYGDNDRLAARVAGMISAECLILLSDTDGLYTSPPDAAEAGGKTQAEHIPHIDTITPEIAAMAGGSGSAVGAGGMVTKIEAARIAMQAGCHMVLADGRGRAPLAALAKAARATVFTAGETPRTARKNWIAGSLTPTGSLQIDAGARAALENGKSLLPVGVAGCKGDFARGDCVVICAPDGAEVARGLVAWSAADARNIIGKSGNEIVRLLGFGGRTEIVHRDDLVLNTKGDTL